MNYFEHAHSPYPLDDPERRMPFDVLVDLSLTVQPDVYAEGVKLTAFRVTPAFVFIAFETDTRAVAHAFIESPVSGRIYQLESQAGEGWIMLGPGLRTAFELPNNEFLEVDHKALISDEPDAIGFNLEVNGRTYPMPQTLTIVADGLTQTTLAALRDLDTGSDSALFIGRDDTVIDETLLTQGFTSGGLPPITRVGPAVPDAAGNIDVTVTLEPTLEGDSGVISVPCGNPEVMAFILWTQQVLGCPEDDLLTRIRFSDCGEGRQYELPFDKLLEKFREDQTPCGKEPPECESSLTTEEGGGSQ